MPLFGRPDIEKLRARGNVDALIKALQHRDWTIRQAAVVALQQIGDPRAVDALVAALQDQTFNVQRSAATALGFIGTQQDDATLRARVVGPLVDTLQKADGKLRAAAAEALHKFGWQPNGDELWVAYWIGRGQWDQCVEIGAPAIEPLIASLSDWDASIRRSAATALGQIGSGLDNAELRARVVDALSSLLDNEDVCQDVARALGEIGDSRATEPLIAVLESPYSSARGNAARALGDIGDVRAAAPLVRAAFSDHNEAVREAAATALVRLGAPSVGPVLGRLGPHHQAHVFELLVRIGAPAVQSLLAALVDYDNELGASRALGQIGEPAVEPLIAALRRENYGARGQVASVLGEIGDARAVEPLIAAVRDGDPIHDKAASALAKIGEPAVEPLLAAVSDDTPSVQQDVIRALGEIGDKRSVEPLIAVLETDEPSVRATAALALGKIGDARAVEPLVAALQKEQISADNAIAALGRIGGSQAVEPLIAILENEPDRSRRWDIVKALVGIADAQGISPRVLVREKPEPVRLCLQWQQWQSGSAGMCNQCGRIIPLSSAKVDRPSWDMDLELGRYYYCPFCYESRLSGPFGGFIQPD